MRILSLILLLLSVCAIYAEDEIEIGELAPRSIVGHFVSGPLKAKQTEICPTLFERDACKVAIFTREAKEVEFDLVASLNDLVEEEAKLKWSFWMVSHENSPTPDDATWERTLADLKEFSEERKVTALSIGALIRIPDKSKVTRARRSVGVFRDKNDMVVMLIAPGAAKQYGQIQYVKELNSAELTPGEIEKIKTEIKQALETLNEGK